MPTVVDERPIEVEEERGGRWKLDHRSAGASRTTILRGGSPMPSGYRTGAMAVASCSMSAAGSVTGLW